MLHCSERSAIYRLTDLDDRGIHLRDSLVELHELLEMPF